jgi:hypothetical protein
MGERGRKRGVGQRQASRRDREMKEFLEEVNLDAAGVDIGARAS